MLKSVSTVLLEGYEGDEHVQELRWRSLLLVALACAILAYVWLFQAATFPAGLSGSVLPPLGMVAPPLVLTAATAMVLALRRYHAIAPAVMASGLVACLFIWQDPMRYYLAPGAVCVIGLLGSRRLGVLATLAVSSLPDAPGPMLTSVWLVLFAVYLSSDSFYALIHDALIREEAAADLSRELLERRGELRRLNDSLRNAYLLLERTNHELAEARDEAEEARRLKARFAAVVSHELRTPLNLILGFTEAMHKMPELYRGAVFTPELRGDIREVYRSARYLLSLVDDVLDLSRVEQTDLALMPQETDITTLIREATSAVAGLFRGRPVRLREEFSDPIPPCIVDPTRIRQVLTNLLTNAARFTAEGEVCVSAWFDGNYQEIVVCVSDTGPGLPAEDRTRVFDAFFQVTGSLGREYGGSGLGLAICKTFVQLHGGRIWVESEVGQGSRFYFSLPLRPYWRSLEKWKLQGSADPFGDSLLVLGDAGGLSETLQRSLSDLNIHHVADPLDLKEAIAQWHPRCVVAFGQHSGRPAAESLQGLAAWPGLPLLLCELPDGGPLSSYPQIRGVLRKPIAQRALVQAVDELGPVRTLLAVDDEEGMTRLIQRMLSQARPHVSVLAAHDGDEALSALRQFRPDALVLDLAMPGRDGLSLLEAMASESLANIPVVVLTGLGEHGDEIAVRRVAIQSLPGLRETEFIGILQSLAQTARPSYLGQAAAADFCDPEPAQRSLALDPRDGR